MLFSNDSPGMNLNVSFVARTVVISIGDSYLASGSIGWLFSLAGAEAEGGLVDGELLDGALLSPFPPLQPDAINVIASSEEISFL